MAGPAMVAVDCLNCGEGFEARVADRNRGWAKFCSKGCKATFQEAERAAGGVKPKAKPKPEVTIEMTMRGEYVTIKPDREAKPIKSRRKKTELRDPSTKPDSYGLFS